MKAISRVQYLGINYRSLRDYALKNGMANKNGHKVDYSAAFIADLEKNYFTREEAMRLVGLTESGFFYWKHNYGVEPLIIGKASLFRKDLLLEKKRASNR